MLERTASDNGKQMLSGVVSAGYSGLLDLENRTWK